MDLISLVRCFGTHDSEIWLLPSGVIILFCRARSGGAHYARGNGRRVRRLLETPDGNLNLYFCAMHDSRSDTLNAFVGQGESVLVFAVAPFRNL